MASKHSLPIRLWKAIENRTLRRIAAEKGDAIQHAANEIRACRIIDWAEYAKRSDCDALGMEPAFHYILAGERLGICHDMFDAKFYARRYEDVRHSNSNLLLHYVHVGQAEGRYVTKSALSAYTKLKPVEGGRPVVIVVDHQASRTGAPILGLNLIRRLRRDYYVVSFVMSDGDLLDAFEQEADQVFVVPRLDIDRVKLARRLIKHLKPAYAILNSVETRHMARDFTDQNVPFVALIQEFTCHYTESLVSDLYRGARGLIFASEVIRDDARDVCPWLTLDKCHICPQGRSIVPPKTARESTRPATSQGNAAVADLINDKKDNGTFVIVGLGTVDIRKGVDLFLSIATALARRPSCAHVRFYWFGNRTNSLSPEFAMFIEQQFARASLEGRVTFAPATSQLDDIYANADALLLCSRLDPMPNVAIDSAFAGTPVVCFDKATGFADILRKDPLLSDLVAPYLDVEAAAEALARLVEEPALRDELSGRIAKLAQDTFRMEPYVELIDKIGRGEAVEGSRAP